MRPFAIPKLPDPSPATSAGIHFSKHVAGGWRTCFPACHNRLIVLQTPSVAPPELNRRATHAGTAPGRRQFRFAGAPRSGGRRVAPPLPKICGELEFRSKTIPNLFNLSGWSLFRSWMSGGRIVGF